MNQMCPQCPNSYGTEYIIVIEDKNLHELKAMLHGAIFLATCNAILLLRDVKLPNTSLHYTPLMFSQHIENFYRFH